MARGDSNICLAKFDPAGRHLWSKQFGEASYQAGVDVAVEGRTDDIVLSGDFVSDVNFGDGNTLVSAGGSDIFLAKFDSEGNPVWSERFGDPAVQETRRLAVDANGGLFLMGSMQGTVSFGGPVLTGGSEAHLSLFLAHFDDSGRHLWSKMVMGVHEASGLSHSAMEDSRSLVVDHMGDVHLAVSFSAGLAGGGQDFEAPGNAHLMLVRFSGDGTPLDYQHYGVDPSLELQGGMAVDAANDVVITGAFDGTVSFGGSMLRSQGPRDLFVGKFTAGDSTFVASISATRKQSSSVAAWRSTHGETCSSAATRIRSEPTEGPCFSPSFPRDKELSLILRHRRYTRLCHDRG